tara:strand:+ start:1200 stop:1367 length:168 start_codon:yes stop_codon:yes gene_type:complete
MAQVGNKATHNEPEVKTRFPVTEGTTLGTTKIEGQVVNLVYENSIVLNRNRMGIE